MATQLERIMKSLNCSKEEAEQILADDRAIARGERMEFALSPEAEKQAKKYANTGPRKTEGVKTERNRKENPTKAGVIAEIANNIKITGPDIRQRQFEMSIGKMHKKGPLQGPERDHSIIC